MRDLMQQEKFAITAGSVSLNIVYGASYAAKAEIRGEASPAKRGLHIGQLRSPVLLGTSWLFTFPDTGKHGQECRDKVYHSLERLDVTVIRDFALSLSEMRSSRCLVA